MPQRLSSILALLTLLLTVTLASCAANVTPTLDVSQPSDTLVAHPTGTPGGATSTLQLTVKRRYPGGSVEDVTTSAHYAIEKGVAQVTARGLVIAGNAAGVVIVRVDDASSDASALATITVVAPQVVAIDLTPSPAKVLAPGETQAFTATARYNSGDVVDATAQLTWSSTDESVAIVGNTAFDKGVVHAVASGNTTVLATDSHTLVQGRATVFVPADGLRLVSIVVTPNPLSVTVGKTAQLRADGVYSDGSTKDLSQGVTWSSSRSDIAAVDTQGLVGGAAAGDATVTATGPGPGGASPVKGSAAVKVVP